LNSFELGQAALRTGDLRTAAERFSELAAQDPADPETRSMLAAGFFDLAYALRERGAADSAVAAFDQSVRLAPDNAQAWFALGNACMEAWQRRVDRAAAGGAAEPGYDPLAGALVAFARAAALAPEALDIQVHRAMAARYACAWTDASDAEAALARLAAAAPERLACEPMSAVALICDPQVQRKAIEGWARAHLPAPAAPPTIRRRGTRLRVGYLSSDLHDHATAHLAAGLFELHDRSRFEVFAYAADRDDGSAMRKRLRAAFEHWRDVRECTDADAAKLIVDDALDVLVDLKGHTHGSRLAILARRPAPVQLHYLGFPGTLGYGAVDALIADTIVAPEGSEAEFAEAVLRVAGCYQVNDHRRVLPARPERSSVGLPERSLVLACFNQTYKFTEPFVATWMEALREHPDAALWLTAPNAHARRHLAAFAEKSGVAAGRLIFAPVVPQPAHLARLRCADLALDVLPYGSHTTGSDALFAGVPLLTCRGTTFAGRVGASLCAAAGLSDLVTESVADYSALLRSLCADRARLAHYRDHLDRGRAHLPLFDTATFTRDFERLLESAANGAS
jgi:protein O-GlcNAc transferase